MYSIHPVDSEELERQLAAANKKIAILDKDRMRLLGLAAELGYLPTVFRKTLDERLKLKHKEKK
jgi:hypothetical protein